MTPTGKPQAGDFLRIDGIMVEVLSRSPGEAYSVEIAHPQKGRTLMVDAAYYIQKKIWEVVPNG